MIAIPRPAHVTGDKASYRANECSSCRAGLLVLIVQPFAQFLKRLPEWAVSSHLLIDKLGEYGYQLGRNAVLHLLECGEAGKLAVAGRARVVAAQRRHRLIGRGQAIDGVVLVLGRGPMADSAANKVGVVIRGLRISAHLKTPVRSSPLCGELNPPAAYQSKALNLFGLLANFCRNTLLI